MLKKISLYSILASVIACSLSSAVFCGRKTDDFSDAENYDYYCKKKLNYLKENNIKKEKSNFKKALKFVPLSFSGFGLKDVIGYK